MKKACKGEYGYFKSERLRRFFVSLGILAVPALILITGILYFGTEKNIMTVVAIVGFIPFAMSIVGLIMVFLHKSLPAEEYEKISPHEGTLTVSYELYVTSEKYSTMIDCAAICGNTVVGYVTDKKGNMPFTQDQVQKVLRANGFHVTVNLLDNIDHFTERLDSMNSHADYLRKDLTFTPDPKYPDFSREEMIQHILFQISL